MTVRGPAIVLVLSALLGCGAALADAPEAKSNEPEPSAAEPAQPAGGGSEQSKPEVEDYYELQKLLVDTMDQVERNYVQDISRRELVEAAIQGVLSKLDPYSSYIEPKELDGFRTSVQSEFGGIGIQLDATEDGQLKILSPLVDTPAYRAGLQSGDRIVEIDGKNNDEMTMDEAVAKLKGEEGSEVTLTVLRVGKSQPEKVAIQREIIHVETVLGDHRGPDNAWVFMLDDVKKIGYIRITAFSRETPRELREALGLLRSQNVRALVLDLRFNPGGLLPAAIEISDMFLSEGRIVSTKGRNAKERVWDARREGTFEGFTMTVLVNRFSASASEILAACLQDHKRAVIIGERTWGKGSVQNVIELENGGSALKLTTATYFRPNGKNIHRFPESAESDQWGVIPDQGYQLRMTDQEILAFLSDRRRRDVVQPKPAPSGKPSASVETRTAGENADVRQSPEVPPPPSSPGDSVVAASEPGAFDPHLKMALEYLGGELARAK